MEKLLNFLIKTESPSVVEWAAAAATVTRCRTSTRPEKSSIPPNQSTEERRRRDREGTPHSVERVRDKEVTGMQWEPIWSPPRPAHSHASQ
jgi:hypothetical protein